MVDKTAILEYFPVLKNERHQKLAMQVAGLALASSALYTSYKLITSSKKKQQGGKEIPEPYVPLPTVGHFLSLGEFPGKTISKWHAQLGPILKLRLGAQTWIMIDDPELAHKIFVTHGAETAYRPKSAFTHQFVGMGGKGMAFAQPGASLQKNRAAATILLSSNSVDENHQDIMRQETYDMVSRLLESTDKDGATDPLKYLELTSLNIILLATLGHRKNKNLFISANA